MLKSMKLRRKFGPAFAGLTLAAAAAATPASAQYFQGPPLYVNEDSLLANCAVSFNNGSIVKYQCAPGATRYLQPANPGQWPVCRGTAAYETVNYTLSLIHI